MRLCSRPCFSLALLLFAGPVALKAQSAANFAAPLPRPHAVLLPLLVTDDSGRAVTSLTRKNFSVTEDGRPEAISSLSSDDAPRSIGILLDLSGSMEKALPLERAAVLQFLHASNPQDEFFLMGFSDHPQLLVDFTASTDTIAARLDTLTAGHRTAFYDALDAALDKLQQAANSRKALLVISDGGDNASHIAETQIRSALRNSTVPLEAIGIFTQQESTFEERAGRYFLNQMTSDTGERLISLDNPTEAGHAGAAMAAGLRLSYLLSYTSSGPNADGKWRKVKIKLSPPPGMSHLTVHARAGYYAPSQ
ncbi:MAG: VWA domain-containing protein [Acidobacteriaceae bacterium]